MNYPAKSSATSSFTIPTTDLLFHPNCINFDYNYTVERAVPMKKNQSTLYSLGKHAKQAVKAGDTLWARSGVVVVSILFLTTIDGITLFSLFRNLLPDKDWIVGVLTVGFSFTLNFIPLVIARFYHFYRYRFKGVRIWMIIVMVVVFFILFVSIFMLRWDTRESFFSGSGMVQKGGGASDFSTGDDAPEDNPEGNEDHPGTIALTILLGIMPLGTSTVNLALSYLTDDPVKKKLQNLQIQQAKMTAQLHVMYAAAYELSQDWSQSYAILEQKRLAAAQAEVHQESEYIRRLARLSLAKKLGDPDSISQLTDNPLT